MTNYTKTTDFAAKDSLPSGNAAKIVKGSEIDTEFNNIATASATKANSNDAVLTGTTTAQTLDISGNVDVDGTLETDALSLNGVTVTSTAAELNYVDGVTSNIQTQLDAKAPLASPTFTGTVTVPGLTTTANVLFGDGDKAIFGAGSDLSIYSDGTQSFIQEDGPGALYIQGTHLNFNNAAGNASYITAVDGGAVTLFSAGSAKLATTSTGISVSGAVGAPSSEDFYRIKLRDTGGIANDVGIGQPDADSLAFNFTPTSGGHIAFFAGSSEKVRIDSSGNVGIGTSSPDALLRVNGTAKIGEGGASNTAKLMVNTASGAAAGIQLFQDGTESWIIQNPASTTALTFANSGTERMRIDSSGNVGIGTTSPDAPLTLNGSSSSRLNMRAGDTRYGTLFADSGVFAVASIGSTPLVLGTNDTERMRIDSGGGINKVAGSGATLPAIAAGLLTGEFKGSADSAVTNDSGFLRLSAGGGTTVGVKAGIDIFRGATDGSLIRMFTNGSEALRLDSSRNLLVGSTNNSNETDEGFKLKPNGEGTNKPRLSISTAGYQTETCLSIYSTAVTAFRFYVDAAGTISAVNTSITSISDERVKENVRDLDDGLDKVLQLQPRKFDWKQGQGRDISNDRGFIAQEFEQVFPDMIEEWKDKAPEGEEPYKAINANLIPTLVKAIQEQQETITALEARITQLENN